MSGKLQVKPFPRPLSPFIARALLLLVIPGQLAMAADFALTPVQVDTFADPLGMSNAWGDYDNDGDLDLAVVFADQPVRLYENRGAAGFVEVASRAGLVAANGTARAVAWADYDNDGDLDVYIGYADDVNANVLLENQLISNNGAGTATFVEVGKARGLGFIGNTRQLNFIDFDADGDLDLHVGLRTANNLLFQNNAGMFTDVAAKVGFFEPRRTVATCWFDMDSDGDLDAFVTNQNGDRDGMYRQDNGRFSDVAIAMDMDHPRRPLEDGGVGCAVTDFDNDGDLDLYVAEYGEDSLYKNNGDGSFTDVAHEMGVATPDHIVTGVWGDVNNDGLPDLYVVGYVSGKPRMPDYLYINLGDHFENQIPGIVAMHDTDHGVQFADYDQDGDLDLALAAVDPAGSHYLFQNDLGERSADSIQVLVVDENGHQVMAGSEVRVYATDTRTLLGTRLVDTGSGYNSQNAMPVHIATLGNSRVDIEVTTMSASGRIPHTFSAVNVRELANVPFVARIAR